MVFQLAVNLIIASIDILVLKRNRIAEIWTADPQA